MKKIKFKQRIENARNAFFDDKSFDTNSFLSLCDADSFLQNDEYADFTPKNGTLETILKQVFLFFPGTFVLYILSMGFTVMFISSFVRPSRMTLGYEMVWIMLLFLAATLMTWLGLGDIRKPKHLIIPASIISVGVFFGAFAGVLITISNQLAKFIFSNAFPLYIFPIALIVPFLAKGWIDRKLN